MYTRFPLRQGTRKIRDCTWGIVQKALLKRIEDLEAKGPSEELATAKRRYLPLTIDDVTIEPMRLFPDGKYRVCVSSRKTGFAHGDLVVQPLPIEELLISLGWTVTTLPTVEEALAQASLPRPPKTLYLIEETGEYVAYVESGFTTPPAAQQIKPWIDGTFFRKIEYVPQWSEKFNKVLFEDPAIEGGVGTIGAITHLGGEMVKEYFGAIAVNINNSGLEQGYVETTEGTPMTGTVTFSGVPLPADFHQLKWESSFVVNALDKTIEYFRVGELLDTKPQNGFTELTYRVGCFTPYPVMLTGERWKYQCWLRWSFVDKNGIKRYFDTNVNSVMGDGMYKTYPSKWGRFDVVNEGPGGLPSSFIVSIYDSYEKKKITGIHGERIISAEMGGIPCNGWLQDNGTYLIIPEEPSDGPIEFGVTFGMEAQAGNPSQTSYWVDGNLNTDWGLARLVPVNQQGTLGGGSMGLNTRWGLGIAIGAGSVNVQGMDFEIVNQEWTGWDYVTPPKWTVQTFNSTVIAPIADWNPPFFNDPFKLSVNVTLRIWPNGRGMPSFDLSGDFVIWDGPYSMGLQEEYSKNIFFQRDWEGRFVHDGIPGLMVSKVADNVTDYRVVSSTMISFPKGTELGDGYKAAGKFNAYVTYAVNEEQDAPITGRYTEIDVTIYPPARVLPNSGTPDYQGNFTFKMGPVETGLPVVYTPPVVKVTRAYNGTGKVYESGEFTVDGKVVNGQVWTGLILPKEVTTPEDRYPIVKIEVELSYPAVGVFEKKTIG